jgi:hypothetical protein
MPPRKKAAAAQQAEPKFADRVDKEPSASTQLFFDWLVENTGYEELDMTTLKLARVLVGEFQKSEVNQQRLADAKAAREAADENGGTPPVKKAAAKKTTARKRAAATVDAEEPPAPTPAKATARRRRRPATATA